MAEATTQPGVSSLYDVSQQFRGALAGAISHPQGDEPQNQQEAPEPEEGQERLELEQPESEEPEAAEQEAEGEEEGISLETLDDLAEQTGLSADELLNLRVRAKVDGEESEVTLADLRKNYQLEQHARRKDQEASKRQKELEAREQEFQQRLQQADSRIQQLDTLKGTLEKNLMGEQDLERLRHEDPEQYNSEWIRQQQIRQQLQQVDQAKQQQYQDWQRQQQEAQDRYLREQREQLPELIPEWRDQETAQKETKEIRDFLVGLGFTEQEVGSVADARLVKMARDAMKYHTVQKGKPEVSKRVKSAQKLQKPGASGKQGKQAREAAERKQNWDRLRKSHSDRDAARVMKGLI